MSTKMHIPQSQPAKVQRTALLHKMNGGLKHTLTLVTAPAGYGKTTALSEWTKQYDGAVAWISLDTYHNHDVRFWSYVAAAIGMAVPSFGTPDSLGIDRVHPEQFLASLLARLNSLPARLTIILDDFHLIDQPRGYAIEGNEYYLSQRNEVRGCFGYVGRGRD